MRVVLPRYKPPFDRYVCQRMSMRSEGAYQIADRIDATLAATSAQSRRLIRRNDRLS
jgi:hypothetical protein